MENSYTKHIKKIRNEILKESKFGTVRSISINIENKYIWKTTENDKYYKMFEFQPLSNKIKFSNQMNPIAGG